MVGICRKLVEVLAGYSVCFGNADPAVTFILGIEDCDWSSIRASDNEIRADAAAPGLEEKVAFRVVRRPDFIVAQPADETGLESSRSRKDSGREQK